MPVAFGIYYTLEGRPGRRAAVANDLSAGGLRLSTDEDFLQDSVLTLDLDLPDDFLETMTVEKEVYEQTPFGLRPGSMKVKPPPFEPMHVRAKVLATSFDKPAKKFAHGTSFIDIDERTQEELQRFIHLWQINFLRHRSDA